MRTIRTLLVASLVIVALLPAGAAPASAAEDCTFPVTSTDATGTAVTVTERPDDIVTLGPSAAQTLYEIGAWDRVVGVTENAGYLTGADDKTQIGNPFYETSAVTERTLAVQPDLVLVPNAYRYSIQVDTLRQAGLTVYVFDSADDLDDVVEKTRLTGDLVGSCESADETADTMQTQLDIVRDALRDEERPKGLYYFFGFTAGSDTFINEIITTAGLENIAASGGASTNQSSGYFLASAETIVAEDPQWFILNGDEYSEASVPAGPNGAFTETTAYKEGNAVVLDANEISQPAPRVMNALLDVVQAVHPEAYDEEIRDRLDRSDDLGGAKQVRSTTVSDGSVRLEARNLGRDKRVSFEIPAQTNTSTRLHHLNVSLSTLNPSFTVDLRYLDDEEVPPGLNGTYGFSRFALNTNGLPNEDVDRLRFRFSVNESALTARNATAENVTLYRHNGTAWSALDTRVVGEANDTVVFEATSPGASTFVVGVPETKAAQAVTATPTPERTSTVVSESESTTTPESTTTTVAPTSEPSTTDTSAPGFGVVTVVVAVVLISLVSRTRVRE